MVQALPGFPGNVDPNRATTIKNILQELAQFQAKTQIALMAPKSEKTMRVENLLKEYPPSQTKNQSVALGMVRLLEDSGGWQALLDYVDALPAETRDIPVIEEQHCLAMSKIGNHLDAIAALETLIRMKGATSEREGLIGGRFKKLYASAGNPVDKAKYLNEAIKHYEQGMMLDLNDYYPASNLPRLYRARCSDGDEEQALAVAQLVLIACRRAKERDPKDEWVRPTLLGAIFDEGDVSTAQKLVEEIKVEGTAAWKLDTTITSLEITINETKDLAKREALNKILGQFRELL
jgi:tetratricopeptide (TPR) repeat protein